MDGKPWTSLDDQITLLTNRGLSDAEEYRQYLQKVGYYRLSGYSYSLRKLAGKNSFPGKGKSARAKRLDEFVPDATMKHVITLYEFDEALRQVVWQAISRLEVGLRVSIGYIFGQSDPYLHLNVNNFWNENQENSAGKKQHKARIFLKNLDRLKDSSHEDFVAHYHEAYNDRMPIWVVTEILDFGALQNLYSLAPIELRIMVADKYRCLADELESWMNTIRILRNTCGHHARLWNRSISRPITRFRKDDPILKGCLDKDNRAFTAFSILAYLLRQQEHHKQIKTIASVLKRFPEQVPQCSITDTGAPANWQSLPMWRKYT